MGHAEGVALREGVTGSSLYGSSSVYGGGVCGVAGNGFIVADESEELGDAYRVDDVLCKFDGVSLYGSEMVF